VEYIDSLVDLISDQPFEVGIIDHEPFDGRLLHFRALQYHLPHSNNKHNIEIINVISSTVHQ
jgi:hypothetical protein